MELFCEKKEDEKSRDTVPLKLGTRHPGFHWCFFIAALSTPIKNKQGPAGSNDSSNLHIGQEMIGHSFGIVLNRRALVWSTPEI